MDSPQATERLAFVVPRYGREVYGGAELHCRWLAERLAATGSEVEVLTTCALDYRTWADHYPPGVREENGVRVLRFPVRGPRDPAGFARLSHGVLAGREPYSRQVRWVIEQGPDCPQLLQFLARHGGRYRWLIFYIYLYYPAFYGIRLTADRALLMPAAHDEPPLGLAPLRPLFHLPRGLLYFSEEERNLVHERLGNAHVPHQVLGTGLDLDEPVAEGPFAARHGIETPYLLYEPLGTGHIVAFTDDPNYRAMYPATQRLFLNAVLFGPGH